MTSECIPYAQSQSVTVKSERHTRRNTSQIERVRAMRAANCRLRFRVCYCWEANAESDDLSSNLHRMQQWLSAHQVVLARPRQNVRLISTCLVSPMHHNHLRLHDVCVPYVVTSVQIKTQSYCINTAQRVRKIQCTGISWDKIAQNKPQLLLITRQPTDHKFSTSSASNIYI